MRSLEKTAQLSRLPLAFSAGRARVCGSGYRRLAGLFLLLILLNRGQADEPKNPEKAMSFHVAMSSLCFRNVNRNDALAAYRVFIEATGREYGHNFKADIATYDDALSFEAALRVKPKHLVVIEAWQYLTMDLGAEYKPFFVSAEGGKIGRKYLILTHRDSEFRALDDLRGKKMLQLKHSSTGVGRAWLDNLLGASGLGTQGAFFGEVEIVEKPTAAVLPVFFSKCAACLVDEPSFEVMRELNPQVGQKLRVVANSEVFADAVLCLNENGWEPGTAKGDTVRLLQELSAHPTGQQILTLFKIDGLVPFEEAQLDTLRKLRASYEALRKEGKL